MAYLQFQLQMFKVCPFTMTIHFFYYPSILILWLLWLSNHDAQGINWSFTSIEIVVENCDCSEKHVRYPNLTYLVDLTNRFFKILISLQFPALFQSSQWKAFFNWICTDGGGFKIQSLTTWPIFSFRTRIIQPTWIPPNNYGNTGRAVSRIMWRSWMPHYCGILWFLDVICPIA